MYVSSVATAPTRQRGGLVSHVLLQAGDADPSALAITWVEVAPGAQQDLHTHDPEQAYVVVRGTGRMRVGDEVRDLGPGELALAPPGVSHGIENAGQEPLVYISAATPSFEVTGVYDTANSLIQFFA